MKEKTPRPPPDAPTLPVVRLHERRKAVLAKQEIELPESADEPHERLPRRRFLFRERAHGGVAAPEAGVHPAGERLIRRAAVLHETGDVNAVHHGIEIGRIVAAVVEVEHPQLPLGREKEVAVGKIALHGTARQRAKGGKRRQKLPSPRRDRFGKAPVFPRKGGQKRLELLQREEIVLLKRIEEHPPFGMAAAAFGEGVRAGKQLPHRLGKIGRHDGELSPAEAFGRHEGRPALHGEFGRKALPRTPFPARKNGQKARRPDAVLCKIFGKGALRSEPRKGKLLLAAHLQNKIARPVPAADDAAERSALPIIRKQRLRPFGRAHAEGKQEAGGLLGRKHLGRDGQNFFSGREHGS